MEGVLLVSVNDIHVEDYLATYEISIPDYFQGLVSEKIEESFRLRALVSEKIKEVVLDEWNSPLSCTLSDFVNKDNEKEKTAENEKKEEAEYNVEIITKSTYTATVRARNDQEAEQKSREAWESRQTDFQEEKIVRVDIVDGGMPSNAPDTKVKNPADDLEIHEKTIRTLTLSTAHITPETAHELDILCKFDLGMSNPILHPRKYKYGYVIDVPKQFQVKHPKDLADCMHLAKEVGCNLLCLDGDGPTTDRLPVYEWEG